MSEFSLVSYLPPSQSFFSSTIDAETELQRKIEEEKIMRFKEIHMVDIVRTLAFFPHPSRETNAPLQAAMFRNEQDKIVESMKVMMAEFCVKKGIFGRVDEAFEWGDRKRERKFFEEV
jgi:hypothetical protein